MVKISKLSKVFLIGIILIIAVISIQWSTKSTDADVEITNVSSDSTRELFDDYNRAFKDYWFSQAGENVERIQSHGGSGKQARSVMEGNEADVVTLALGNDIASIEKKA